MVESSDKTWSPGEENDKPLQHSCLENPMNIMKRQNDMTLKVETPRSVGAQYAIREQWRNSPRRNKEADPKQKQCPVVDVYDGVSKIPYCKEQNCIGTWNVRSMNQGKLEVDINILGIRELKWMGMDDFNLVDHYIHYC